MAKRKRPLQKQILQFKDDAPVALLAHATMSDGKPWVLSVAGNSRKALAALIRTLNQSGGVTDLRVADRQPVSIMDLDLPPADGPRRQSHEPSEPHTVSEPMTDMPETREALGAIVLTLNRLQHQDEVTLPVPVASCLNRSLFGITDIELADYATGLTEAIYSNDWADTGGPPPELDELIQTLNDALDNEGPHALHAGPEITQDEIRTYLEQDDPATSDSEPDPYHTRIKNVDPAELEKEKPVPVYGGGFAPDPDSVIAVHLSQEYDDALEAEQANPQPYHNPHALQSASDPNSPVSKLPGNRRKYRPAPRSKGMTSPSDQLPANVDPRDWYAPDHPNHPDNLNKNQAKDVELDNNDAPPIIEQPGLLVPADPERWTDPMPTGARPEMHPHLASLKTSIITALDLLTTPNLPALEAATAAMQAQLPPCCAEFNIRCAIVGIDPHIAGAIPDPRASAQLPDTPAAQLPHRCPACSNLIFDLTKSHPGDPA